MKHNIFLATILLLLGSSCQQTRDKKSQAESVIADNGNQAADFAVQDSIFAESIGEIEEEATPTSSKFSQQFLSFLEQNPASLNYNFPKLVESGMHIADSPDKKIRIYSWDDNQGGSMRYFNNVFQASYDDKQILNLILTNEDRVYYPFYTHIEPIILKEKTYYVAFARNIFSHRDVNYSVELYIIEDNKISPAKLFKTTEGLDYVLGETFNYHELVDEEFILLDPTNLTISFPEVNEDGELGKNRTIYQFKGEYFEKK